MRRQKVFMSFVVAAALAALVVGAYAQGTARQQQQQLQQQQMLRMQTMTQQMIQVQDRAQNLVKNLEKKMAQTQTQTQTETQAKLQAQIRALKQMGEGTVKMAGEMKGNLELWREMYQNRELYQDKQMTEDMKQVQNRLEKSGLEHVSTHLLRHTTITRLAEQGVDLRTVMEIANWQDPRLLRRYAAASDTNLRAAVSRL